MKKIQKRTFRRKAEIYKPQTLSCPYCGQKATLQKADYLFTELDKKRGDHYYVCKNYPECNTYISCNKDTFAPYGELANAELRRKRMLAHKYIDKIVDSGLMSQYVLYNYIAAKLNVPVLRAHIRYSTDYTIEVILDLLRGVLKANGINAGRKIA